ncbi:MULTISPECIES: hemerythrin domain-containing protein [unclassified Blastococcus]
MTATAALPFPVTPRRTPDEPEADLFGFALVHRALRNGCRLLADALTDIAAGGPCDRERQQAVVAFAGHMLHEVHVHHSREDDVLWPVIAASAGAHVDLAPLSDDHAALQDVLDRAEPLLAAFAAQGPAAAAPLAAVVTQVADSLDEHIAEEERDVFPVVRRYVSAGDFARVETRFRKGTSLRHMVFVLPWVVDACRTPEERAQLLGSAPAPLRLVLRGVHSRWVRRRDLVRGS